MSSYEAQRRPKTIIEVEAMELAGGQSVRAGDLDPAGDLERQPLLADEPCVPSHDQEDAEFSVSAEEWMEVQLLDCQSLARQNGYAELAVLLDEALDQLARVVGACNALRSDSVSGHVYSFSRG